MSNAITWTPLLDVTLLELRRAGCSWPAVARSLAVGRSAAIERARHLGVVPSTRLPQPAPVVSPPRSDRAPLAAGHPLSWGAITDSTALHGVTYPYPVFL